MLVSMSDGRDGIEIRWMNEDDGPAIAEHDRASPDTGVISFSTEYLVDPYEGLQMLHPGAIGVVAVEPGRPGIAGMGAMTFGMSRYEGDVVPCGYLFNVSVNPAFRRRGIATRMYDRLIARAREMGGDRTIIVAGIQEGNEASLRAAGKWFNYKLVDSVTIMAATRRKPPRRPGGGPIVRDARPDEWPEILEQQNAFYNDHNFYRPRSVQEQKKLYTEGGERTIYRYLVVQSSDGSLVAGAGLVDEGAIEPIRVARMPALFRTGAKLFGFLSPTGLIRRIPVRDMWCTHLAAGRLKEARAVIRLLWHSIRWEYRERADIVTAFVDRRGPVAALLPRSFFIPRSGGYIVVAADHAPTPGRLIYHDA